MTPTGDPMPGFDGLVGLTLTEVSAERVTATLEIQPALMQPYGIVHGGVFCTAVETCASVGAATWFGDRGYVVGVSNHTDFLRAQREGTLRVTATPVHRGRTQQLWQVEVTSADGKLAATGQVRLANVTEAAAIGA